MGLAKLKKKEGQSLVEFALVSLFFLVMVIVSINVVFAFVVQQYLAYATFMAARSYQAAAESPAKQRENACNTFKRFIPSLTECTTSTGAVLNFASLGSRQVAVIRGVQIPAPVAHQHGTGAVQDRTNNNYIGLTFEVPFFKTNFGNFASSFPSLTLNSRSFLGREVSTEECGDYFNKFYNAFRPSGAPTTGIGGAQAAHMYDNGC